VKKIVVIMAAFVFYLNMLHGCVNSSKQEEQNEIPVGAKKQHDTRVIIICKDANGQYSEKSLHISQNVTCGGSTFKLKDFARLHNSDQYVAFPGQQEELQKYLTKIKEP
jgi:hypothetical protein